MALAKHRPWVIVILRIPHSLSLSLSLTHTHTHTHTHPPTHTHTHSLCTIYLHYFARPHCLSFSFRALLQVLILGIGKFKVLNQILCVRAAKVDLCMVSIVCVYRRAICGTPT